ncbi:alpha-tocopherol transfer protein-like [Ixodes scapularis]
MSTTRRGQGGGPSRSLARLNNPSSLPAAFCARRLCSTLLACTSFGSWSGVDDPCQGLWDPLEYGADEMFRTNLLCVEHAIQDVETQVRGIVLLNDLQGMSLHHVRHCPPTHFIKIIHLIQDAFPGRFKAVHLVHEPSVARALLTVLLPLIKPKLQTRIMFHGSDMSSLHEHISPEVLPQEYGGGGGHMDNQDFVAALLEGEESFRRDLQYGYADK